MIQFTQLSAVVIADNRQRKDFNPTAHEDLKTSIREHGLFHAPVMRVVGDDLVLVAGESRIRAMTDLHALGIAFCYDNTFVPEGYIPYVNLGSLDELAAEEAELEENIRRTDLTPQERALAIKRIHDLRTKQAKVKGVEHTVADTARELTGRSDGSYQANVKAAIAVAENLHIPAVAKAKTMAEAIKVIKNEDKRQQHIAMATAVGKEFTAESHTLLNTDSEVWVKAQPDGVYDVILTDPPYGMGADEFGDAGGRLGTADHQYEDSYEYWKKFMAWFCPQIYRVAKPQAHAYVFCDIDRFHELKSMMEAAGWYVFRTPLIDYKTDGGRVPIPDRGPRRSWEMILYAIKGDKPVTHIYPDVIPCVADKNMGFGAQKPVALFQNLLQRSVLPGDKVLDLCCGTGPIFPAAHALQCQATGIELAADRYGMSLGRLRELKALDQGVFGGLAE